MLSIFALVWASALHSEPLCFDPKESSREDKDLATRLEKLFSDHEVERAWNWLGDHHLDGTNADDEESRKNGTTKSTRSLVAENTAILFDAFMMQRAYRLRAELELAAKTGASPTELAARRKAFEKAREQFRIGAGHAFGDRLL